MKSNQVPYPAILAQQTTLFNDTPSPATQLKGRSLRTILPYIEHHHQYKQKFPPINSTRTLPELKSGDTVRIDTKNKWKMKGELLNKLKYPHSYLVGADKSVKIRRNQHHLLQIREKSPLLSKC